MYIGIKKSAILAAVIMLIITIAGCSTTPERHRVNYGGGFKIQNGTFSMNGTVGLGIGAESDQNFSNVVVLLYNEDKKLIKKVPVGDLSTYTDKPTSHRINISIDKIPEYIIIESPDFWATNVNIQVIAYYRTGERYEEYVRHRRDKFPKDE